MFDLIHHGGCHDSFVYFDYITDRGQGDCSVVVGAVPEGGPQMAQNTQ